MGGLGHEAKRLLAEGALQTTEAEAKGMSPWAAPGCAPRSHTGQRNRGDQSPRPGMPSKPEPLEESRLPGRQELG